MLRSDQRAEGRKPGGGTAGTVGQTVAESKRWLWINPLAKSGDRRLR